MSFYFEALKTRLRLSFNKFFVASFILYLMFVVVTVVSYNEPTANAVKIGFVYEDTEFTNNLISQYEYYGDGFFLPVRYNSKEELETAVIKNDVDCGYILPNDYDKKSDSIELIRSGKTITSFYNNLLIGSIYLQYSAPDIGYSSIKNIVDEDKDVVKSMINNYNEKYLEDAPFMSFNYYGTNGQEVIQSNGIYIILYGVIGLFLTLFGLIFYLQEIIENNSIIYLSLKNLENRMTYYFANLSAYFIMLFSFGIINVFIIKMSFVGEAINFKELITLVMFSFMVSTLVFTLSLLKNINAGSLFIMFYFVTACIFGNVFIEIDKVLYLLSKVEYLYPTHYFKIGMLGESGALFLISIISVAFTMVNYWVIKNVKFNK